MPPTKFKEVSYNLSTLMDDIEMGDIGLPDIQRPFVWPNTKVRDLFDSMYRGYPVGYLLFWENSLNEGVKQIGTNTHQTVPKLLIVDGQQRLTTASVLISALRSHLLDHGHEALEVVAGEPLF